MYEKFVITIILSSFDMYLHAKNKAYKALSVMYFKFLSLPFILSISLSFANFLNVMYAYKGVRLRTSLSEMASFAVSRMKFKTNKIRWLNSTFSNSSIDMYIGRIRFMMYSLSTS